ncbi:MAG TPA: type IV pilin-like G/H family protein [Leptolyngbyaceae cyanobacterium]
MPETSPAPNDFTPDDSSAQTSSQKSKIPAVVWIFMGLGCGCLGLFVLGIVAAIALPAFLNQANNARESEAKNNVKAVLRGQQAYILEKNAFATTLDQLQLSIPSETENYTYEIAPGENESSVFVYATPKDSTLKGFTGAVYIAGDGPNTMTYTGVCQGDELGILPPIPPALDTDMAPEVVCPPGSSAVN